MFIARFLSRHKVNVLNVAGKRGSATGGIRTLVTNALDAALVAPADPVS